MSSYNLYSEEHCPRPTPVVKMYDPNSGWGRPDRITTTREYNNFTVDFVHSKSDRVVSHENYKGSKSLFRSLFSIPEPISVLHPILVKYDRWISNLLDGSIEPSPIPDQGFLGQTLGYKIRHENGRERFHLTVLLHQSGEVDEYLSGNGYIEVLFTQEYEWEKSNRNRFIFDLNGNCIESQSKVDGTFISTNDGSDTPLSVLDIDRTKTEKLKVLLSDWYISENDFYESFYDEFTPSECAKITNYLKVCNQVLNETKEQLCEETYSILRKSLHSNIIQVIEEVIND